MMQFDSVKSIINRFPQAAGRAQKYQYIDTHSPFYDALLRYFRPAMPYEIYKGRKGDPADWIEYRLEELGFFTDITNWGIKGGC